MSRIETGADPAAILRWTIERAIDPDERRMAESETPRRLIVVTGRTFLVGTTGWLMGNQLHLYRRDRIAEAMCGASA